MTSNSRERCSMPRNEWKYTETADYSIVTEYDISCGDEWLVQMVSSVFFFGWAIGAIPMGWIVDRFGRKMTVFPCVIGIIVITLLSGLFSADIVLLIVERFILGVLTAGAIFPIFVWMSEFTTSKYSPLVVNLILLFQPISWCLMTLKAYFIREWKTLVIVCSAPYLIIVSFIFFIPESVRWLVTHRKEEELKKVLKRISFWNKKEMPGKYCLPTTQAQIETVSFLNLFRRCNSAIDTLIQGYAWMVVVMVYLGLTFSAKDLGDSMYLSFVLITLSDIPSIFLSAYCCNRFGRKTTVIASMFMSCAFCFLIAAIPIEGNVKVARIVFAIISKGFNVISYNSVMIWSLGLYPTSTRAGAFGFLTVMGRVGAVLAPWIAKLSHFFSGTPFIVMGTCMLISVCSLFKLPEKKNDDGDVDEHMEESAGAALFLSMALLVQPSEKEVEDDGGKMDESQGSDDKRRRSRRRSRSRYKT